MLLPTVHLHPQDLRGLKLSKFRNFPYFINELNPFISTMTYRDNCWTLLATRNAQSLTLSKHSFVCEESGERENQDATNRCLLSTSVSTCFGIIMPIFRRTRLRITKYGVLHWLCWLWLCGVGLRAVWYPYAGFSLHKDTTPPQPNHTVTPTHIEPEQYNP